MPVLAFALVSSIEGGARAASTTNPPRLALSEVAPASVLHGNHATIQLQASDPGTTSLSGLAIRALLPAGVDYRAGSTSPATAGEPNITHDASGKTALVWTDLADLGSGSSAPLSFQVDPEVAPSANAIAPGKSFTIDSSAYASTDAAAKPSFDALTGKAKDGVVSATASGSTAISALSVTVTSPSSDGRMLRGVHDHQSAFTVSIANNGVAPTKNVVLDGYLSAALEFIGCGDVDNGRVEYQYAKTLAGRAGTPTGCRPALGETAALKTDALGAALPSSPAWTHVQWSVGDLAPGDTQTISFLAGVPLRANAPFGSSAPSPQSLRQLANLDNNTGPQTDQAGAQTVLFEARGADPTGAVVGASGSTSVTPVDIAVTKSIDQSAFAAGQQVVETVTLSTSEYVDARQIAVNDLLPSGIGPGLTAPTPQYATPPAENADGTSTLSFLIAHIAPNGTATITVPLRDLARYRANSADTTLVAAGDTFSDAMTVTSTGTTLRCASPDGLCAKGAVQGIDGSTISTTIGLAAGDTSTLQSAPQAVVTSSVSERPAPGTALDCSKATYVPAASSPYVRNDVACLRLHVAVPAGVPARSAVLTASIPSGLSVSAPDIATGPQAVQATALTHRAAGDLAWALGAADAQDASGTLYAAPSSTFDVTLPVRFTRDPTSANADDALLATFRLAGSTHGGGGSMQRSATPLSLTQPRLSLHQQISAVAGPTGKRLATYAERSRPQAVAVSPRDLVTFDIAVGNAGHSAAAATEIWTTLPDTVACDAVSAISGGGVCTGGIVRWDSDHHNAISSIAPGGVTHLVFTMRVPADIEKLGTIGATADVRSFSSATDAGSVNRYAPKLNVDPTMSLAGTSPVAPQASSADVIPPDPTLDLQTVPQGTTSFTTALGGTGSIPAVVFNQTTTNGTAAGDTFTLTLTAPGSLVNKISLGTGTGTSWTCLAPATNGVTHVQTETCTTTQGLAASATSTQLSLPYTLLTGAGSANPGDALSLLSLSFGSNGAGDTDTGTPIALTVNVAAVKTSLSVSHAPDPFVPGSSGADEVTWLLSNDALASASGDVTIHDGILPTNGITFVAVDNAKTTGTWNCSAGPPISCTLTGPLSPGSSNKVTFTTAVAGGDPPTRPSDPVTDHATIFSDSSSGTDQGVGTNSADETIHIAKPNVGFTVVSPGPPAAYDVGAQDQSLTLRVKNNGAAPTGNTVQIDVVLDNNFSLTGAASDDDILGSWSGCAYTGSHELKCTLAGPLAAGASATDLVIKHINVATTLTGGTVASSVLTLTDNTVTFTDSVTQDLAQGAPQALTVDVNLPNIASSETVSSAPFAPFVQPGDAHDQYQVTVTNNGLTATGQLTINGTLGSGLTFHGGSPIVCASCATVGHTSGSPSTWSATITSLATGASATITIHVDVTNISLPATETVTDHVTIADSVTDAGYTGPSLAVDVAPVDAPTVTSVTTTPTTLVKGQANQVINVKIHNPSASPTNGKVVLLETLESHLTFVSGAPKSCVAGTPVTCALDNIPSGDFTEQITVNVGDEAGGLLTNNPLANTAELVETDASAANRAFFATVPVGSVATLAVDGASISGHVYDDKNANGAPQGGDGLAVQVTLTGNDTESKAVSTSVSGTGPNGTFTFRHLPPADAAVPYKLVAALTSGNLAGVTATPSSGCGTSCGSPAAVSLLAANTSGEVDGLVLGAGATPTGFNFGQLQPVTISGKPYLDNADQGTSDGTGTTVNNAVIHLTGSINSNLASDFPVPVHKAGPAGVIPTAQDNGTGGAFSFGKVYPGTYILTMSPSNQFAGRVAATIGTGCVVGSNNASYAIDCPALPPVGVASEINNILIPTDTTADANNLFAVIDPSKITYRVFDDKNNSGTWNFSTQPSQDLGSTSVVTLSQPNDIGNAPVPGVSAELNGVFTLSNLRPAGSSGYTLTLTEPTAVFANGAHFLDGLYTAGQPTGNSNPIAQLHHFTGIPLLGGNAGSSSFDFAEVEPSSVEGFSYIDTNDNGSKDVAEVGLAGQTITLSGNSVIGKSAAPSSLFCDNVVNCQKTTDATGHFLFINLYPGTLELKSDAAANRATNGLLAGTSHVGTQQGNACKPHGCDDDIAGIALGGSGFDNPGVAGTDYDFAELHPNTISGFVYNDTEDKGCYASDTGAPGPAVSCVGGSTTPLSGVAVALDGNDDAGTAVTVSTTSAGDGSYTFSNLRPGAYNVTQQPTPGKNMLVGKNSIGAAGITGSLGTQLGFAGTADHGGAPDYTVDPLTGTPTYPNPTTPPPTNKLHGLCLYVTTLITPTTSNSNLCLTATAGTTGTGCAQQCEGVTAAHNDLAEVGESSIDATVWQDPCENDVGKPASTILDEFNRDATACFPQVPGTRLSAINLLLTQTATDGGAPIDPTTLTTGPDGRVTFLHLYPGQYKLAIKSDDGYRDGPMIPLTAVSPNDVLNGVTADPAAPPVPVQFPETVFSKVVLTPDSHTSAGQSDPTGLLIARRPPSASLVTTVTHSGDVIAGTKGTYSIKVDNNGPSPAQGPIVVIDSLPPGMTFDSFTDPSNQWLCTPLAADVLCTFPGQLSNPGQTPTFNLTVDVSADQPQGAVNNDVVATSATKDVLGNNRTTDSTNIVLSSDLAMHADLSGLFGQNGVAVYVMTVTNNGPSASPPQATVTDSFPRELTPVQFAGDWQCYGAGQTVTCYSNNPIEPGTSRALALFALVGVPNGSTVKDAVMVQGLTNDPNLSNNNDGLSAVVGSTLGKATINGPLPQLPTSGVPDIGGPNTGAGQRRWTQALLLVGLGSVLVAAAVLVPGRRRRSGKDRA